MILKANATLHQQINTILREHVTSEREFEVELPAGAAGGEDAGFVGERETELDDLEQVHVAFEGLVVVVGRVRFLGARAKRVLGRDTSEASVRKGARAKRVLGRGGVDCESVGARGLIAQAWFDRSSVV